MALCGRPARLAASPAARPSSRRAPADWTGRRLLTLLETVAGRAMGCHRGTADIVTLATGHCPQFEKLDDAALLLTSKFFVPGRPGPSALSVARASHEAATRDHQR